MYQGAAWGGGVLPTAFRECPTADPGSAYTHSLRLVIEAVQSLMTILLPLSLRPEYFQAVLPQADLTSGLGDD